MSRSRRQAARRKLGKTPLPVHVTYLTAWVNKDGSVNFRRDVYNRDKQLAGALAGSLPPEDVSAMADNAAVEE